MIRENQRFLNHLNMVLDALLAFLSMPLAFWFRFHVFHGIPTVPLSQYYWAGLCLAPLHVLFYAFLGLYESARRKRAAQDLSRLLAANTLIFVLFQMSLFVVREMHFSRGVLLIDFFLVNLFAGSKQIFLRRGLRRLRSRGYNLKHVVILGSGPMARSYAQRVGDDAELGLNVAGYVSDAGDWTDQRRLGSSRELEQVLDQLKPDEVVAAIEAEEYQRMPEIIAACEKSGVKLSLLPFYADYMPSHPQIDSVGGLPLINLRRIPLDNLGNAFVKRSFDLVGSLLLLLFLSPVMLLTALGVKLSSPGPVIFKQTRVGRNKREFSMYKFRSMRVNNASDTAWSTDRDDRKTRFGSLIRKCSLDELPQLLNVLKGDMSLVGPRPEIPHFVEQFKEEIPLYMVKHQVRPGMTGWAQVNGLRGDTSIAERIRHDIYYIENWNLFFDLRILFMTLFRGINREKLN